MIANRFVSTAAAALITFAQWAAVLNPSLNAGPTPGSGIAQAASAAASV